MFWRIMKVCGHHCWTLISAPSCSICNANRWWWINLVSEQWTMRLLNHFLLAKYIYMPSGSMLLVMYAHTGIQWAESSSSEEGLGECCGSAISEVSERCISSRCRYAWAVCLERKNTRLNWEEHHRESLFGFAWVFAAWCVGRDEQASRAAVIGFSPRGPCVRVCLGKGWNKGEQSLEVLANTAETMGFCCLLNSTHILRIYYLSDTNIHTVKSHA
jgi:hypothetical protein